LELSPSSFYCHGSVICVGDPASFIGGSNAWTRRRLSVTPFCVYGHRCSYKLRDAMHRTHLL
jgi:hypothetical protein